MSLDLAQLKRELEPGERLLVVETERHGTMYVKVRGTDILQLWDAEGQELETDGLTLVVTGPSQ